MTTEARDHTEKENHSCNDRICSQVNVQGQRDHYYQKVGIFYVVLKQVSSMVDKQHENRIDQMHDGADHSHSGLILECLLQVSLFIALKYLPACAVKDEITQRYLKNCQFVFPVHLDR